jgi:uncharacterized protein (DUF433 family)
MRLGLQAGVKAAPPPDPRVLAPESWLRSLNSAFVFFLGRPIVPAMLDWSQCPVVERGPGKSRCMWRFKGTHIPATLLFENLEDGATVNDFLEWYPGVTREQVLAVLAFAERSLIDQSSTHAFLQKQTRD